MKPYQPIDCNFYDVLEATATKRKAVPIVILENGQQQTYHSKIIDLYHKDGVEYMVIENDKVIRLDEIVSVDAVVLENFGCKI